MLSAVGALWEFAVQEYHRDFDFSPLGRYKMQRSMHIQAIRGTIGTTQLYRGGQAGETCFAKFDFFFLF